MLSSIVTRSSAVLRTTKAAKDSAAQVSPVQQAPKFPTYHPSTPAAPLAMPSSSNGVSSVHAVEYNAPMSAPSTPRGRVPYSQPHHARHPHLSAKIAASPISIPAITQPHAVIGRTTAIGLPQTKARNEPSPPLPTVPEVGMIVEFFADDGSYRLGLVSESVEKEGGKIQVSEKHRDSVMRHELSLSQITFCWPHLHNSHSYHFKLDDLSSLTEQVQLELEKCRTNLSVLYGNWIDANVQTVRIETAAGALFNGAPRPHEYYVAHRLLQESDAFVRPSQPHAGTSIVGEYVINPLNLMSSLRKTYSQKQQTTDTKLFLHRLARKVWSTRNTDQLVPPISTSPKSAGIDSTVELSQSTIIPPQISLTGPFAGSLSEATTLEQFISGLPALSDVEKRLNLAWNPHRDAPFLTQLKAYAFADESAQMSELLQTKAMLLDPLDINATSESVFNLLVQVGVLGKYDNPFVARYNGKLHFSAAEMRAYLNQGTTLAHADRDCKYRRDYRNYSGPIFAIDSRLESAEIDDALAVFRSPVDGSTWVHIHIADPSRFVNPNDNLDILARQRVQSVYVPEKVATMFPPNFARHHFSLLPGKTNYALTFAVQLDPTSGQILNYEITPSLIDKVTALTYDQADEAIKVFKKSKSAASTAPTSSSTAAPKSTTTSPSSAFSLPPTQVSSLNTLLELGEARRRYRERAGALFMDQMRPEVEVLNNGETISVNAVRDSESATRGMVSEFMILVGEVTALFASRHSIPIPFRSQAKRGELKAPVAHSLNPSSTVPPYSASPAINRARLCPAVTNVQPGEHAGLGLTAYCQVTSPIRRYTDLLIHHQIKSFLRGEALPFSSAKLTSMIATAEGTQAQLNTLASNSSRYWILRFLERQDPARQYEALVSSDMLPSMAYGAFQCVAWISDLGWKTSVTLEPGRNPSAGEIIQVRVQRVDAFNDDIEFAEVQAEAPYQPSPSPTL